MEEKNAPLTVRNVLRRPLTFRVGGKTVRLAPGEALNAPGTWLGSAQFRRVCEAGFVAAERASEDDDDGDEEDDDEKSATKRRRKKPKGAKTSRSKSPKPET